jgi:tartrate-resistant acid phosphatase type 5
MPCLLRRGRPTCAFLLPLLPLLALPFSACGDGGASAPIRSALEPATSIRFAAIGDFGYVRDAAAGVAELVAGWNPDFVVTLGDNCYEDAGYDVVVGRYYRKFIAPYRGSFGAGASQNRFFPALGNHDWDLDGGRPYFDFFTLPGNERYYEFVRGPVHFFVLDSDPHEPDGTSPTSAQGRWLYQRLAASTSPFRIVYLHHPPFSSGAEHGSSLWMQWPFAAWGVSAVLAGHEHLYERIERDGITYVVNGLGGAGEHELADDVVDGSQRRFTSEHGAMLIEADAQKVLFRFVTGSGVEVDRFTLTAPADGLGALPPLRPPVADDSASTVIARGSIWSYLDDGSDQGTAWRAPGFADGAWRRGPARLGYGEGDEATTLRYGSDPDRRYVTTYFRRTFSIADVGAVAGASMDLLRDDGAVVYVNGREVHRSNMPTGTITAETRAAAAADDEDVFTTVSLPADLFVTGGNTIAVEIHQVSRSSSDISFDLGLSLKERAARPPASTTLVARGTTWSYLDHGAYPPSSWRALEFDDRAWRTGAAELGYGDGDEATVVDFGGDAHDKRVTTHLRRRFTVADPAAFQRLHLALWRDDGAVVYLNGKEILRSNMPSGAIGPDTEASGAGDDGQTAVSADVDPSLLVPGSNVLAIEVHQNAPDSSDLTFDLELGGE